MSEFKVAFANKVVKEYGDRSTYKVHESGVLEVRDKKTGMQFMFSPAAWMSIEHAERKSAYSA